MEKDNYDISADAESSPVPDYAHDRKGSVLGEAADLYGNTQVAEQVCQSCLMNKEARESDLSTLVWIC